MARVCEVTGKAPMVGNNVSHANNKTKRRFMPNLQYRRFWVESENRWVRLRVSSAALRLIDKKGIDVVLADMRERAARYNRTLRFGYRVHVIVRETEEEAREHAAHLVAEPRRAHGVTGGAGRRAAPPPSRRRRARPRSRAPRRAGRRAWSARPPSPVGAQRGGGMGGRRSAR